MEERQEVRKVRRIFSPEQKFEILKDIERCQTIKEGLAKHRLADSVYYNGSGSWRWGFEHRCETAGR
jgi:hypothetical protein